MQINSSENISVNILMIVTNDHETPFDLIIYAWLLN